MCMWIPVDTRYIYFPTGATPAYLYRPEGPRSELPQLLARIHFAATVVSGQRWLHVRKGRCVALRAVAPRELVASPVEGALQQIHLDAPPASGSQVTVGTILRGETAGFAASVAQGACMRRGQPTCSRTSPGAASSSAGAPADGGSGMPSPECSRRDAPRGSPGRHPSSSPPKAVWARPARRRARP
jgi:hypothetical protein